MPFPRKRKAVVLGEEERQLLERIQRSRTEAKQRTVRAAILLGAAAGCSDGEMARSQGVNRNTVLLCIQKFLRFGLDAALGELPRAGRPRRISDPAIAWIQHVACQKPKDLGYAPELWTYALLQSHVRRQGPVAGYGELKTLSQSRLHDILRQADLRPHKVRYYVERRDPEFEQKMATVLHVYKEVEILNDGLLRGTIQEPALVRVCDMKVEGYSVSFFVALFLAYIYAKNEEANYAQLIVPA
jgi:transposase